VLVVDDEPLVRTVVSRTLGKELEVVTAGSAAEALARVRAGERFDLLLSDLQMPEQTGMDLHAELAREAPELARRMIFFSGGAYTEEAREFLERQGVECIEKPFDLDALRTLVAGKLAAFPA
jgi:CheY-like chemotaxis protein